MEGQNLTAWALFWGTGCQGWVSKTARFNSQNVRAGKAEDNQNRFLRYSVVSRMNPDREFLMSQYDYAKDRSLSYHDGMRRVYRNLAYLGTSGAVVLVARFVGVLPLTDLAIAAVSAAVALGLMLTNAAMNAQTRNLFLNSVNALRIETELGRENLGTWHAWFAPASGSDGQQSGSDPGFFSGLVAGFYGLKRSTRNHEAFIAITGLVSLLVWIFVAIGIYLWLGGGPTAAGVGILAGFGAAIANGGLQALIIHHWMNQLPQPFAKVLQEEGYMSAD